MLYLTPNAAAHDLLAEDTLALYAAGLEPDEETMMRLQWIERNAQTDELFSNLWTRVTAQ